MTRQNRTGRQKKNPIHNSRQHTHTHTPDVGAADEELEGVLLVGFADAALYVTLELLLPLDPVTRCLCVCVCARVRMGRRVVGRARPVLGPGEAELFLVAPQHLGPSFDTGL